VFRQETPNAAPWRDSASTQAQADLEGLLNAALGFAQRQLVDHGEFFPYAAAVRTDGEVELIPARHDTHDDHPRSVDLIDACVAALVSQRNHIRAGAIVLDTRLSDGSSDAIRVDLEHAEGHAIRILLPYTKKRLRKKVDFGQLRAEAGKRQIWP